MLHWWGMGNNSLVPPRESVYFRSTLRWAVRFLRVVQECSKSVARVPPPPVARGCRLRRHPVHARIVAAQHVAQVADGVHRIDLGWIGDQARGPVPQAHGHVRARSPRAARVTGGLPPPWLGSGNDSFVGQPYDITLPFRRFISGSVVLAARFLPGSHRALDH